jgi:glutamyl-tRNA synthetase
MEKIRVRFAPSPTGVPHIGGIRSALYNYLFAKHSGGKFLLRIEDTDRKRFVEEAEVAIVNSLKWLGLDWDEEIIHQSERLDIYKKHASILLDKKIAYEKDNAIWVKMPENKIFSWVDLVGNKEISFEGKDQQDFVALKSDGFPTYHLANVVDDHLMEITHVIRGEEWISSVPKHLHLYESFGWNHPEFAHMPVILGPDKGKLSKRHGAKSVLDYKNDGFLKEAILNFIAILGWNPGGDKEILSLEEMVKVFDIKDINTSNPKFDLVKLEWMNGVYVRSLSDDLLKNRLLEFYKDEKEVLDVINNNPRTIDLIIGLAKTRMKTLAEFKGLVVDPIYEKVKVQLTTSEKDITQETRSQLSLINEQNWTEENILKELKDIMEKNKIKMSILYKIFFGTERGLPLPQVLAIIGKEQALKLLNE